MIFRIAGGIFFLALALQYLHIAELPTVFLGILALVAGVALLAGK